MTCSPYVTTNPNTPFCRTRRRYQRRQQCQRQSQPLQAARLSFHRRQLHRLSCLRGGLQREERQPAASGFPQRRLCRGWHLSGLHAHEHLHGVQPLRRPGMSTPSSPNTARCCRIRTSASAAVTAPGCARTMRRSSIPSRARCPSATCAWIASKWVLSPPASPPVWAVRWSSA